MKYHADHGDIWQNTPLYCRVPQKIPNSEESKEPVSRGYSADNQADFCRIQAPKIVSDASKNFTSEKSKDFL